METPTITTRNELISDFLNEAKAKMSEQDVEQWVDILIIALNTKERLPYSDITVNIYNYKHHELEFVQENITKIFEKLNVYTSDSHLIIKENLSRFEDHIRLAINQRDYINRNVKRLEEQLIQRNAEINELTIQLNEAKKSLSEIASDIKNTKSSIDEVSNDKTKIYTEFVAILGIFTAVVLGAFGSLQVIGSVFSNIKGVPTGKLLVFSSLTSLGVLVLLFLLMKWINHIVYKNSNKIPFSFISRENTIFISGLIALVYMFFIGFLLYAEEPKKTILSLFSNSTIGIGFFVCLTLLTLVAFICFLLQLNKKPNNKIGL